MTAYGGDIRTASEGTRLWLEQFPLHDLYLRVDRRHFDIVTLAETLNIQLPNRCKRSVNT